MKRVLGTRQVGVAELFGLFLHLPGRFGAERAQSSADEVADQCLQESNSFYLCLDLFLERAGVDLMGLVRLNFFLLGTLLNLRALLHSPKRRVPSGERKSPTSFRFNTTPRAFLMAAAFGASESAYASSISIFPPILS